MKLYDAAWAPNPRRVRIYLAEKAISIERVAIDLRADEQLGDSYRRVNPRGTVPALVLDTGEVIADSVAICRFLEALHPEPPLFGTRAIEVARVEAWTRRVEQDGYAAAVYALRERAPRFADRALPGHWPPVPQIPELATRAATMWTRFAAALDERLAESEWVAGEGYTFADVSALVTIDFARAAALDMPADAVHLRRWHAAATARPSAGA